MAYKEKNFPFRPRSATARAVMQSCAFILAVNWVMQGMRGMDSKELTFRLLLEAILMLLATMILATMLPPAAALCVAAILAHSFSFLFNGQLWVCARYCRSFRGDAGRTEAFLARTARDIRSCGWLEEAVCIGSKGASRSAPNPRSDIDLRLIFPSGLANWLRLNALLLRLRTRALIEHVPLDLFAYDSPASLERFDQSEPLLVIIDKHSRLHQRFGHRIQACPTSLP